MKKSIRVLEVLEATVGGTRKHLISLLTKIDRQAFLVEVASPRVRRGSIDDADFYQEVQALKIPWHQIDMQREINLMVDLRCTIQLARLIKRNRYDLVHVHSSKAGFLGRIAAKINGVKTIYTPNGVYFLESQSSLRRHFYLILEQFAGILTDRFIAVSESERQAVISNHIIKAQKVAVIPNAIDSSSYLPSNAARIRIRGELNIPSHTFVVGIVSRYIAQKDPFTLVRAAKQILCELPDVRFIWCGEGELRKETEHLAHDLGIHTAFHFLGFRQDVQDVMNTFDLFVLSSTFEGLPYTLLEVMALGIPIVATNVVGSRDVVVDGVTGVLIQPQSPHKLAQAVIQLLRNPMRRKGMGYQGQNLVQHRYDLTNMVRQIESLYHSVVNHNKL